MRESCTLLLLLNSSCGATRHTRRNRHNQDHHTESHRIPVSCPRCITDLKNTYRAYSYYDMQYTRSSRLLVCVPEKEKEKARNQAAAWCAETDGQTLCSFFLRDTSLNYEEVSYSPSLGVSKGRATGTTQQELVLSSRFYVS